MIAQAIQLSLAPVFVLVAIGNILNILSTRLGRVVDRARVLQDRHTQTSGPEHDMIVQELRLVDRRMELITHAIRFLVIGSLLIGVTVAVLFLESLVRLDLHNLAAAAFIAAIFMLMVALVLFLRETRVAGEALRIPRDYLELHREL